MESGFLTRLNYDVRLVIYSHMILPPFSGCHAYAGLFLSCRQLQMEIDDEGTRQLGIYLSTFATRISSNDCCDTCAAVTSSIQARVQETPLYMDLFPPKTVLGNPRFHVHLPFILPPPAESWYRHGIVPGLRPDGERQQESHYRRELARLFSPVAQLHSLWMKLNIQLTLDPQSAIRVADESVFEVQETRSSRRIITFANRRFTVFSNGQIIDISAAHAPTPLLATNALGCLLGIYTNVFSDQVQTHMHDWHEPRAFPARRVRLDWNFSAPASHTARRGPWCHGIRSPRWHGVQHCASTSTDRRVGSVRVLYNLEACFQEKVRALHEEILRRSREARGTVGVMPTQAALDVCALTAEFSEARKRLEQLGIHDW